MLTTHTKKIDGFEIIIGFGYATVDPEATKKVVAPLIDALPESAVINQKKRAVGACGRKLGVLRRESMILWTDPLTRQKKAELTPAEKLVDDRIAHDWNGVEIEGKELESELTDLWDIVKAQHKELIVANSVFFEPNAGEYHLDQDRTSELMQAHMGKSATEQVTVDGEIVSDYRNIKYWLQGDEEKWLQDTVNEIGREPMIGAIADEDITEDQRAEIDAQQESERVAGLSADAKQIEIEGLINQAAQEGQQMEARLKFEGNPDYSGIAQGFYNSEVSNIESKYGV